MRPISSKIVLTRGKEKKKRKRGRERKEEKREKKKEMVALLVFNMA